jgi:hypothetical protein
LNELQVGSVRVDGVVSTDADGSRRVYILKSPNS